MPYVGTWSAEKWAFGRGSLGPFESYLHWFLLRQLCLEGNQRRHCPSLAVMASRCEPEFGVPLRHSRPGGACCWRRSAHGRDLAVALRPVRFLDSNSWLPCFIGAAFLLGIVGLAQFDRVAPAWQRWLPLRLIASLGRATRQVFLCRRAILPVIGAAIMGQTALAVAPFALAESLGMQIALVDSC